MRTYLCLQLAREKTFVNGPGVVVGVGWACIGWEGGWVGGLVLYIDYRLGWVGGWDVPGGQGAESTSFRRLVTPSKAVSNRAQKMCWWRGAKRLFSCLERWVEGSVYKKEKTSD